MRGRMFFFMESDEEAFLFVDFQPGEPPIVPPLDAKVVVEDKPYTVVDIVYWYGRHKTDIGVFVRDLDKEEEGSETEPPKEEPANE